MLWGLVRPQRAVSSVTIERKPKGASWRVLKTLDTTATGVYSVKTTHRTGQTYRVKWTAPDGKLYTGPAVQGYQGPNPTQISGYGGLHRCTRVIRVPMF